MRKYSEREGFVVLENEIWKDVKGWEELYECSSLGRIKAKDRTKWNRYQHCLFKGGIIKPTSHEREYLIVIFKDKPHERRQKIGVHRVIALTFIENPDNKSEVNHKNGIKYDNRVENLEWATCAENLSHARENGLRNNCRGEKMWKAKLTEKDVIEIRDLFCNKKVSAQILAGKYGVGKCIVWAITSRRAWKHI